MCIRDRLKRIHSWKIFWKKKIGSPTNIINIIDPAIMEWISIWIAENQGVCQKSLALACPNKKAVYVAVKTENNMPG